MALSTLGVATATCLKRIDEARKPVTRAVGEGSSDDFEAGAFEEGLGSEKDIVGAGALVAGSGVGLYDRSAVLKRILCRRPNEGHGDSPGRVHSCGRSRKG